MKEYIRNRFYLRGTSWLGILNTITACICNRVLVREVCDSTGYTISYSIRKGTDFKPVRYQDKVDNYDFVDK
jgi:hypothetical protein